MGARIERVYIHDKVFLHSDSVCHFVLPHCSIEIGMLYSALKHQFANQEAELCLVCKHLSAVHVLLFIHHVQHCGNEAIPQKGFQFKDLLMSNNGENYGARWAWPH